jgi:IS605 OrfB family transposase
MAVLQNSRLSARYKQAALKQAYDLVIATKKSAKAIGRAASIPVFAGGMTLDSRHLNAEDGKHSFDLVLRLSSIKKGRKLSLPVRRTRVLNKWLARPGAKLLAGGVVTNTSVILWVSVPIVEGFADGPVLAVDAGVNKLLVDSNGVKYGTEFKALRDKITRKRQGSKAKRRALVTRDHYINKTVNALPWNAIAVLGVEDLTGIKQGKKKGRSKAFRKAMAPWVVRQVIRRIEDKASENRVCLIKVDPANTSRTCPVCGGVSKENRRGEVFQCTACNHTADADYVGALNILAKTLVNYRENIVPCASKPTE